MDKYRPPIPKYQSAYRPRTPNREKLPEAAAKKQKQTLRHVFYRLAGLINPLILLGYCFITVLTPRMGAFDAGGPKFLALAILNLGAFGFLLLRNEQPPPLKIFSAFFNNRIGFIYGMFLAVSLLSFIKAVNPVESLLAFTKLFTVFTSALIISAILRVNKKYLTIVAVGLCLLLLADATAVFYQMWNLTEKYPNFAELYQAFATEVKSGYSNKNILASAMFIKLPFALWLWSFGKGPAKIIGLVSTFAGFIALMPLSARAFYLGLALLAFAYLMFIIIRFLIDRTRWKTALVSLFIVALIPLFIYLGWLGLSRVFPTAQVFNLKDRLTLRLESIKQDVSSGTRIVSWQRSVKLIKEEPLFGVGVGNWKINVLKYENQTLPDYTYYYYNHNDFLQTTAESGIVGGLLFLSIFIGVGWVFLYALFKGTAPGASYEYSGPLASLDYLFIPAFGLLCYSVDAFYNFPFDRPEIQSLWAIFLGAAVAFTPEWIFFRITGKTKSEMPQQGLILLARISIRPLLPLIYIVLIISSIFLLYLNFKSLKLQRMVKQDINSGVLTHPAAFFIKEFPFIPTVGSEGEPVALSKARYLLNDKQLREAIELLKNDRSSPYESRIELFIASTYLELGNTDSAVAYARRVYKLKPLFSYNNKLLIEILDQKEQYTEALKILDDYIATGFADQSFVDQRRNIDRKVKIQRVEGFYYMGVNHYERKNYKEAVKYFTEVIKKEPALLEAYNYRALCNFYLKEYLKCQADVDHLLAAGNQDQKIINLRDQLKNILGN